jgi:hypothetical protein
MAMAVAALAHWPPGPLHLNLKQAEANLLFVQKMAHKMPKRWAPRAFLWGCSYQRLRPAHLLGQEKMGRLQPLTALSPQGCCAGLLSSGRA